MPEHDLILHGGHVIDPAQGIDGAMDVAFCDGAVSAVAPSLETSRAAAAEDVSGCIVTPGLIDLHTHVYWGGTSLGVDAEDYCRASAVTTTVDTGSVGPGNFAGFRAHVIDRVAPRVLVYLHVSHAGIYAFSDRVMVGESEEMRLMDPLTAIEVARANPDLVIGIKVRLGRWTSGDHGIAPLHYAEQVAGACGLPMMVHIDDPPPSYDEVCARLRPGDVLTHCFRPFPNTPLNGDGTVRAAVLEARERGVIFDIGHGFGSFSFEVARDMAKNGFWPDTISSDVHQLCINGPAFDLVTTMSKFLDLGLPLPEIIRAATQTPARAVRRPELGSLAAGTVGDASILRIEQGRFGFTDTVGDSIEAGARIAPVGTILKGALWHRT